MKEYIKLVVDFLMRFFILLLLYSFSRFLFYIFNLPSFSDNPAYEIIKIFIAGVRFDFSSLVLSNLIFFALFLLPVPWTNNKTWRRILNFLFLSFNFFLLSLNFIDIEYFKYTHKRSTADFFQFVGMSRDVLVLIPVFLRDFWYILLIFLVTLAGGLRIDRVFRKNRHYSLSGKTSYRLLSYIIYFFLPALFFIAARGLELKPVRIITAARFTSSENIPLIINTPFSVIHTFQTTGVQEINYFPEDTLSALYSPVHTFSPGQSMRKDNVMVIILESFSKEYSGYLNGNRGCMPFLDSLMQQGLVCKNAFASGMRSIEAIPAVLAGLPGLLSTPYISSEFSANHIRALPFILKEQGYHTSFFHGGRTGTMGFDDFCHMAGIDHYYGMEQYRGVPAYDGNWGIYDMEFLDFFRKQVNSFPSPFFSCLFTLSSHHPYRLPKEYENKIAKNLTPLQRVIQYTDLALKFFFQKISTEPWYKNTLFVLVADHTGGNINEYYKTATGIYRIPLVFYHPCDSTLKGTYSDIVQQTDIMPSILHYLRYSGHFLSYGNNLFDANAEHFSINCLNDVYYFIQNDFILSFDGNKTLGLFNWQNDSLLVHNITAHSHNTSFIMERKLKAIVQDFTGRMIRNQLTVP